MRWRVSDSLVFGSEILGCSGDSDMTGVSTVILVSGFHLSRAGDPKHKHAIAGFDERFSSVGGMTSRALVTKLRSRSPVLDTARVLSG